MKNKYSNFVLAIIHRLKGSLKRTGEGGILIRYTRSKKFRKRYKALLICIQLLMAWYFLVIAGIQINSYTNASFNDIEENFASFSTCADFEGTDENCEPLKEEWDNSSLDFDPKGVTLKRGGSCISPSTIYAEIYNDGEDMTFSTWKWELFKVGKGDENNTPISPVLDSGEVEKILAGKIGKIESTESLAGNGNYRFKVTKPDRPGQDVIWSESIEIEDCPRTKTLIEESKTIDSENNGEKESTTEKSSTEAETITETKTEVKTETELDGVSESKQDTQIKVETNNTEVESELEITDEPAKVESAVSDSETDSESGSEAKTSTNTKEANGTEESAE